MSPTLAAPNPPTQAPAQPRWRWSTAEFRRLAEEGYFGKSKRTFLWDGEIIEPMPPGRPPGNSTLGLFLRLNALFPEEAWTIDVDMPLALRDGFEPQPDVLLLRGPRTDYLSRVPTPADVALLVEVSGSTYFFDSGEYLAEYARAGIMLYWIVNLNDRRIEVYTDPDPERGSYRSRTDYAAGVSIPLGEHLLAADEILRFVP